MQRRILRTGMAKSHEALRLFFAYPGLRVNQAVRFMSYCKAELGWFLKVLEREYLFCRSDYPVPEPVRAVDVGMGV